MDIKVIRLRGQRIQEQFDRLKRRMARHGLIESCEFADGQITVEFANAISANNAYYDNHEKMLQQGIEMLYEEEESTVEEVIDPLSAQYPPEKMFKPDEIKQVNRSVRQSKLQGINKNWIWVAIIILFLLIVSSYSKSFSGKPKQPKKKYLFEKQQEEKREAEREPQETPQEMIQS